MVKFSLFGQGPKVDVTNKKTNIHDDMLSCCATKNVSTLDRFKRSLETLLYFKQTLSSVGENLRMDKKEKYPNQLLTGFQNEADS